jgi:pimeloyl-ACP methyl ester carboxylesterase
MNRIARATFIVVSTIILVVMFNLTILAQTQIRDRFANVNGVKLHYLIAGKGEPVILLHGYAENSHMWRPLMMEVEKTHTVIAPDLRGFGQSSKPMTGFTKKTMAQDVHALATSLGLRRTVIVGHDIGLMVAYAYGAMRAGFEVFHSFEQDAKDFAEFAQTKLTMPMLVLTGEKASGEFLIEQARLVDSNVDGVVIKAKGHWLMEEAPKEVIPRLVAFISKAR